MYFNLYNNYFQSPLNVFIYSVFAEAPVEIVTPLKNIDALEKDTVTFTCDLSKADRTDGLWKFNGEDISLSEKFTLAIDGYTQSLTITELTLADMGQYSYSIENVSTSATLRVGGGCWGLIGIIGASTH